MVKGGAAAESPENPPIQTLVISVGARCVRMVTLVLQREGVNTSPLTALLTGRPACSCIHCARLGMWNSTPSCHTALGGQDAWRDEGRCGA